MDRILWDYMYFTKTFFSIIKLITLKYFLSKRTHKSYRKPVISILFDLYQKKERHDFIFLYILLL